jgi:hypothetical protein
MQVEEYFKWAFRTGCEILSIHAGREKGKDLLERLIYYIRAEESPGRFFERLAERLTEYRTNKGILANVSLLSDTMSQEMSGDRFYYAKAAILAGFLNALSAQGGE